MGYVFLVGAVIFGLSACNEDPIVEPHEEIITSVLLTLTPDSGAQVILLYRDADGEGGMNPIITNGKLKANTSYTGSMTLSDANGSNKTEHYINGNSVTDAPNSHQIFYTPKQNLDLNVSYSDTDDNGYPFGLQTSMLSGNAGHGMLTVTILHEPNKPADGVADGDMTNAGGSIDLQIDFQVTVEE